MRDIPMFTTAYGVASLALSQIPYSGRAYIHVRSAVEGQLEALVQECADFCRAAGAETVFWTCDEEQTRPYSAVLEMRGQTAAEPALTQSLFPVTSQTVGKWRQIHNERMQEVDHAAYLTEADEKMLLSCGAYFIHRDGELLGIGWLEGDTVRAIASVRPGAGESVAHTLMSLAQGDLRLEVASTNIRAIRLYEKLGFIKTREICRWYRV